MFYFSNLILVFQLALFLLFGASFAKPKNINKWSKLSTHYYFACLFVAFFCTIFGVVELNKMLDVIKKKGAFKLVIELSTLNFFCFLCICYTTYGLFWQWFEENQIRKKENKAKISYLEYIKQKKLSILNFYVFVGLILWGVCYYLYHIGAIQNF
ncbi:hypothetical protein TTHT_1996 [Thermotomaculum hydrothermale]|uniref:Uncharacterized protein n=1 Tax=Thermotomaculum hydrothermale TaxID=981385 RepID=A0A7R6PGR8_9BACT|nr:hypothetical protein [Thermotomaculum hydrothermale]BBB33439.1 hypothetical protein TTHT_1996 [Thermotomaculum hydrothermale]